MKPKLLRQFATLGKPGGIIVKNGAMVVSDGYHGLLVFDQEPPSCATLEQKEASRHAKGLHHRHTSRKW